MATVTGRTTTIAAGSNGTLIATRGVGLTAGGGWTNAGNYGVAQGAQEAVKIGAAGTIIAGGKQVPVQIGGSLSKDVIAGAIAGCASGSILGCAIGAGTPLAIAYITSSGGLRVTEGNQVEKTNTSSCSAGQCYEWSAELTADTGWMSSPDAVCSAIAGQASTGSASYTYELKAGTFPRFQCNMQGTGDREWHTFTVGMATRASTASPTWNPATPADVKDALIKAGPPPPMIVPELEKAGVDWNKRWPGYDTGAGTPDGGMAAPNVTGPSSLTGDKTTTTNSDGTRTTTQSSTPLSYGPGKVTAGPTSSVTTTTNADGSTRTSTTTTEPGTEEPKAEEDEKDTDWCEKHPDRIGCIEVDVPKAGELPRETKTITYTPEDFGRAGQCPADVSMSFRSVAGIGSAKIIDWTSFCAMAVPLRAVVLALASIMAFFILMPGGRVE